MAICNEQQLFQLGIKPAYHINDVPMRNGKPLHFDTSLIEGEYYVLTHSSYFSTVRGSFWVHDRIYSRYNCPYPTSEYDFGILMGYPPDCCELFCKVTDDIRFQSTKINFNGLAFNTMGLIDYALDWCILQYGDAIRRLQGYIWYEIDGDLFQID